MTEAGPIDLIDDEEPDEDEVGLESSVLFVQN